MAELLDLWLKVGLKELRMNHYPHQQAPPFVFLNTNGEEYSASALSYWWKTWLADRGGAPCLPPSMCRHIFVDERMSDARVEGPLDNGAAMAMGNSEAMWAKHYNKQKHFHPRDCQRAVNSMETWRNHLMGTTSEASTSQDTQGKSAHAQRVLFEGGKTCIHFDVACR